MSAWQDARAAAFAQMIAEFPSTVTYKTATVNCIATSKEWSREQQRTDFLTRKPMVISISQTDYQALKLLGLQPREVLECQGDTFQVYSIIDDPTDASVDLRCYFKL